MTNQSQQADSVARLLRSAGPRELAPSDRARGVEAAVRAEWREVVRQRHGRTHARWFAGGALAAAVVTLILQTQPRPIGESVAAANARVRSITAFAVAEGAASAAAELPAEDATPGFSRARAVSRPRRTTLGFRGPYDDRVPDGGLPRRILVNYSWETR